MAIDSKSPEIVILKERIESLFGRRLEVHSDFEELRDKIFSTTKEHISETTLERIWGYSTRGYNSVSKRILDILSSYTGAGSWYLFLHRMKETESSESDLFDLDSINSIELHPGARLRIGWPPDRDCVIRYVGDNRYVAEETSNSKLLPGDTFSCNQFQLHRPNYLTDLKDANGNLKGRSYGIGLRHGLTSLQLLFS